MLTKISEKFRELVSPSDQTLSRKRKLDSDVSGSEIGPSPAKRTRQDTTDQPSVLVSRGSRFSQFTDWVTRKTAEVTERSFIQALSPSRLLGSIRDKMTSQPRQSTPYPQQQQQPLVRQYLQPHSRFSRPHPFTTGDVREKTSLPQPKFSDSIMSPGGHVVPPRAPRGGNYGYQSRFDPTKQPQYSFARQQSGGAPETYSFRAPIAAQQQSYSRSATSYNRSHMPDLHRSMYNKLYGKPGNRIDRHRHRQAAKESIRIEEKKRYADLLKNYTHRFEVKEKRPIKVTELSPCDVQQIDKKQKQSPAIRLTTPMHLIDWTRGREQTKLDYGQIDLTEDSQEPQVDLTTDRELQREENGAEVIDLKPEVYPRESIRSYPRSPINESLQKNLTKSKYATKEWMDDLKEKCSKALLDKEKMKTYEIQRDIFNKKKPEWESELERSLRRTLTLSQREPPVIEEPFVEIIDSEEEDETDEFVELTPDQEERVNEALVPRPSHQVLVKGFKLQLTRNDIGTLGGLEWLNDEVINFYMNMLMERGAKEEYPSVHAFSTFFYPKLRSDGHAGVKRWTKRGNIDLFAKDYVLIPVHLGVHWCLAVIDFTKKEIRYYDAMGSPNNGCLNALKQYLEAEHLDKKKESYSTTDWILINVNNIPQQMNGSDCGMFACKFAEYVSRSAEITFTQENMPYFRRRMILELLEKTFMT